MKFLWTTRLLSFNWQNRWNHIIYNKKNEQDELWCWGSSHYVEDNINKVTSACPVVYLLFKCKVQNETVCLRNVVYDWLVSCMYIHYMRCLSVSHKGKATISVILVIYYRARGPMAWSCPSHQATGVTAWNHITSTNSTILPCFTSLMPADTWICLLTLWCYVGNLAGQVSGQRFNVKID